MNRVFIVLHSHEFDDGHEDVKLIGAYSTRRKAVASVARARVQPGFCDHPQGFHIEPYEFDVDHWTEGFFTEPWGGACLGADRHSTAARCQASAPGAAARRSEFWTRCPRSAVIVCAPRGAP